MTNFVLGERGKAFLRDFFSPVREGQGSDPVAVDPVAYFEETFVAPADLPMAIQAIGCQPSQTRLIVIDGHPRIGKTWFAIAAIARVLDEQPSLLAWDGGVDSRKLFPAVGPSQSVYDAISKVEQTVHSSAARLILLDDLFGTVTLRELASDERGLNRLGAFFDVDGGHEESLRHRLPEGTTVIITGRAVLLTAAEIVLGRRIRSSTALRLSRGLFRRQDGSIGGSFEGPELDDILRRNAKFVAQGHRLPEMTALAPTAPASFASDPRVPRVLFRPEFDALASVVNYWSWAARQMGGGDHTARLSAISRAYVLELAAGLVFLGPTGYRALGVGDVAGALSQDLYVMHERGLGEFGRVANEVYVAALRHHFRSADNVETAVRAIRRVVDADKLGIAARGLLELTLSQIDIGLAVAGEIGLDDEMHDLRDIPQELIDLIRDCPDPLLQLELTGHLPLPLRAEVVRNPGFCSAVGWAVVKLPAFSFAAAEGVICWVLDELRTAFLQWAELPPSEADALLASYSTLLHWAVVMETETEKGGVEPRFSEHLQKLNFLDRLGRFVDTLDGDAARQARMVLDDELIWACTALPSKVLPKHRLVSKLSDVLVYEAASATDLDAWTVANRVFTISWHNDQNGAGLADILETWRGRWCARGKAVIKEDARLIDANLKYHWWHFLTQRGVWMRDWCVTEADPLRLERTRPASGSRNAEDNRDFYEVVQCALSSPQEEDRHQRFRDCLMLVGTRSSRFPRNCGPTELFKEAECVRELGSAALEAIFELSRENYLMVAAAFEGDTPVSTGTAPDVSDSFRKWCRELCRSQDQQMMEGAWRTYHSELEDVTHLDVLPNHWNEVLPEGW
jgi:hypothetical protein